MYRFYSVSLVRSGTPFGPPPPEREGGVTLCHTPFICLVFHIAVAHNMFRLTSADGRYGLPGRSFGEDRCPALHDSFRGILVGRGMGPSLMLWPTRRTRPQPQALLYCSNRNGIMTVAMAARLSDPAPATLKPCSACYRTIDNTDPVVIGMCSFWAYSGSPRR